MFRKRAPGVVLRTAMELAKKNETDESLVHIIKAFRDSSRPFLDFDETIEENTPAKASRRAGDVVLDSSTSSSSVLTSSSPSPAILTYKSFSASLTCPKKFYLLQNRQDLTPDISIGEAVHIDDGAAFNELARRWDRLQFGSRAVVVHEDNFDRAVERTEEVLVKYFQTLHAHLGEQAPSLTIHRPAFAAPFGRDISMPNLAHPTVLRARPAVLRFRPKDNQWVILETAAILDPLGNATRLSQCLQRLHFTTLAFRYWVTQSHIPIQIRKRFLDLDTQSVTEEKLRSRCLESTSQVAVPLDLKRSGFLHIRQFFPGPVTLMDCDPSRLVKYVQRLSLEDMLDADTSSARRSGNAFDLGSLACRAEPLVAKLQTESESLQKSCQGCLHLGNSTSSRAAKQKSMVLQQLFAAQQKLMEALITTHTLRLVEKGRDPANMQKWVSFASLDKDILKSAFSDEDEIGKNVKNNAHASKASTGRRDAKGNQKNKNKAKNQEMVTTTRVKTIENDDIAYRSSNTSKSVPVPEYSEFIGAHCSRGDTCPFFVEGMCLPNKFDEPLQERDNHLFTIPSISVSRKALWWEQGFRTVRDVLCEYKKGVVKLTAPQLRHVKAVASGKVYVNPKEIDDFFSRIRYPAFLIDFEATQFALPPFDKLVPYQPTPFQFSLDVFQEDILTETPTHYDFLHFGKGYSPNVDPRRGCLVELMRVIHLEREKKRQSIKASEELGRLTQRQREEDLEGSASGSKRRKRSQVKAKLPNITRNNPLQQPVNPYDGCFVAHFASFEKSCLEKLGQLMGEYKEDIKQFYFLDTLELFKRGFVHPNTHGSNSLKKVLPALCPDFQYGVFGGETCGEDDDADGTNGKRQDEQKGENAMGVYRLWHHHEGGGSLKDLLQVTARESHRQDVDGTQGKLRPMGKDYSMVRQDVRERAWAMLRIQLLEYCSLDTKALYEIMRQVWREREAVKGIKPDKGGWVMTDPLPREYHL